MAEWWPVDSRGGRVEPAICGRRDDRQIPRAGRKLHLVRVDRNSEHGADRGRGAVLLMGVPERTGRSGIAVAAGCLHARRATFRHRRIHRTGEHRLRGPEEAKPDYRNDEKTTHCDGHSCLLYHDRRPATKFRPRPKRTRKRTGRTRRPTDAAPRCASICAVIEGFRPA